jgi:hypothetical protein
MTYFNCFNVEKREYVKRLIQLVGTKRTEDTNKITYYLTEAGYNLLLATFEFEDNMKLTVQELIFKINLENKDYAKALDDVKNIFMLSKRQVQALTDAIQRIKENVTTFTADNYTDLVNASINTIEEQNYKFKKHTEEVERRERDLIELQIQQDSIMNNDEKEDIRNKLEKLSLIKKELSKITSEHARVQSRHYDFKKVYGDALVNSIKCSRREVINLKQELEEVVTKDLSKLGLVELLFRPLFTNDIEKVYSLDSCLVAQKSTTKKEKVKTQEIVLKVDKEEQRLAKEKKIKLNKEKKSKYRGCMQVIFDYGSNNKKEFDLRELLKYSIDPTNNPKTELIKSSMLENIDNNNANNGKLLNKDEIFTDNAPELFDKLVPTVYILEEILIKMLTEKNLNIEHFKKDIKKLNREVEDKDYEFEVIRTVLEIVKESKNMKFLEEVRIIKPENKDDIVTVKRGGLKMMIPNLSFKFITKNI